MKATVMHEVKKKTEKMLGKKMTKMSPNLTKKKLERTMPTLSAI